MDFPNNRHSQHSLHYRDYSVYAGAAANEKGPWWTVIDSMPYKASGLILQPYDFNSTNAYETFLDVGIGPVGNEAVVVPDLETVFDSDEWRSNESILLPIGIAAGTRVSIRSQCAVLISGSPTGTMLAISAIPLFGGEPKYNIAETIGVDYANTRGAALTGHGTSLTSATWYTVAANGFTRNIKAIRPHLTVGVATQYWGIFQIGVGDTPVVVYTSPLLSSFGDNNGAAENIYSPHISHPIPIAIPAGQKISVRAYCGQAQTLYMTITGFA